MSGTHPHASTTNDPQSQVRPESLQEKKEGHGIFGAVKGMFHDATARSGDALGHATASASEPINKIQGKSDEASEAANRQLDNAKQWTKNDPQSQVLSETPHEQKEGRGIFGAVTDLFHDAKAKSGDAMDRATASASEPINKIQGKSNEASEAANRQLDNAKQWTKNDPQSQVLSETPHEQKEGRGIFGAVTDLFHDAAAKSGDAVDRATALASEPINKIQGKSNEASEAATTQFENAKQRTKNDYQSQVLPDPPKEKKEGQGIFGAVTNLFHDATSKSGDAVGNATASAAEPINKIRDKSNDASEAAKKQFDNTNNDHQSHGFPDSPKKKKEGHGIFGSVEDVI
ncbi:hypothetical protein BC830DRAFT_1079597 [Chytriomyces sp. MP71]|nr:hypothetical protein BC830DRAFT_1079597 [Chytriomyces sp. MP71]